MLMPAWAATILAGVIIGLISLLWRDLIKRIDAMAAKLEQHGVDDSKAHERVTVLETKIEAAQHTIQENYNKFHRFQTEMRERADTNSRWLTEQFAQLYKWLHEKLEALRK